MTRQIVLRSPSSHRRQPLLAKNSPPSNGGVRFAEVAGEATAECAAVCCCCPCGLVNLILLAVYKLPAGLCRRAMRKKRLQKRLMNTSSSVFAQRRSCKCGCDETEMMQIHSALSVSDDHGGGGGDSGSESLKTEVLVDKEALELEKEMWDRFYSTGFWRSPSQRDNTWL